MRRSVRGLSLLLALACGCVQAGAPITLTFAEPPVQVWRDTSLYGAPRGAVLQAHDIVDAGAHTVMLAAGGTTLALGPASQLFIQGPDAVVLLRGWLKVRGAATQGLRVATALTQFDSTGATVTLHAAPGSTELFAEAGDFTVAAPGRAPAAAKLAHEQYGVRAGTAPLKLAPHPPAAFLAALPRTFLDPLLEPLATAPGPAPPLQPVRAATYAELAPLLADFPALRQPLQRRFAKPLRRRATAHASNVLF